MRKVRHVGAGGPSRRPKYFATVVCDTSMPSFRSSSSTSAAGRSADAAEVERVERELVAAIAKTDLATYDRIVADDYVAYTVTGDARSEAMVRPSGVVMVSVSSPPSRHSGSRAAALPSSAKAHGVF